MSFHIEPQERAPLNELDHTKSVDCVIEVARMLAPHMQIVGGANGEVVFVGKIFEREDGLNYPSSPIDMVVHDGRVTITLSVLFGEPLFRAWVAQQLCEPMLTQIPMNQ